MIVDTELLRLFDLYRDHIRDPVAAAIITQTHVNEHGKLRRLPEEGLLTVAEAAKLLSVSDQTIYNLCHGGKLEFQRIGAGDRGTIRIRPESVEQYSKEAAVRKSGANRTPGPSPLDEFRKKKRPTT